MLLQDIMVTLKTLELSLAVSSTRATVMSPLSARADLAASRTRAESDKRRILGGILKCTWDASLVVNIHIGLHKQFDTTYVV